MKTYTNHWEKYPQIIRKLAAICLIGLLSCSDHDDPWIGLPGEENAEKLEGFWQSEGYGYVLEIHNGIATVYDVTRSTCLKKTFFFDQRGFAVNKWDVEINTSGTRMIYKAERVVTKFQFTRIARLPDICSEQLITPTQDAQVNFDVLWQTFEDHYAFFDKRKVDWMALRAKYRPQVTESNLKEIFHQMLSHFEEDHVSLISDGDDFINRYDAGVSRTFRRFYPEFPNPEDQKAFKTYLVSQLPVIVGNVVGGYLGGQASVALDDQLIWGELDPKTAYVFVGSMSGYELSDLREALDKMSADVAGYDRIVMDLRFNLGGNDHVILELAGRFLNQTKVAWRFAARNGSQLGSQQEVTMRPTGNQQFGKPIVLLTSIMTSSAAEIFTLMMKERGNVRIAGETTNGIFSTTLTKQLPNGWIFTLSNEVLTDAKGTGYEGTGISPDVAVGFPSKADREAGIDPALENYKGLF